MYRCTLVVLYRVEGATPEARTKGRSCSKCSRRKESEAVVNGSFWKAEKTSKLGGWRLVVGSLIGGLDFATVSGSLQAKALKRPQINAHDVQYAVSLPPRHLWKRSN